MRSGKILFRLIIVSILLSGCSDISEGFKGKKIDQGEEFLINKKNPLVVPPDFDKLPEPVSDNSIDSITADENLDNDIKKLFEENVGIKTKNESDDGSNSTEESILKKIK
jgi:hypothetical protein|tara:strand:- start:168 stop:497 length:330 start_codon:yes stop_codon:yes gene_type:complete